MPWDHSRGPWEVGRDAQSIFQVRTDYFIAQVERPGDAYLIAMAPELLEALEQLVAESESRLSVGSDSGHETASLDRARRAIKKTKGG